MAYNIIRFLITLLLINLNNLFASIIYDKNGVTVNELELTIYKNLYQDTINKKISNNIALKNYILLKKTINYLNKNNPKFIKVLDENISKNFLAKLDKEPIKRDYFRFFLIRNEFISEYFMNEFTYQELKILLDNYDIIELPLSKNRCLTISNFENLKGNDLFIKSLYEKFKDENLDIKVKINLDMYDVCMNKKKFNEIKNMIIEYITLQTQENYENFIYSIN